MCVVINSKIAPDLVNSYSVGNFWWDTINAIS